MHALLIHQAFVTPGQAGGTRHYELAKRAVENGHRFSVVASDISYLSGERTNHQRGWIQAEVLDGIRIYRAYTYPSFHKSFSWRIVSFLSFMITSVIAGLRAGKVDVVIGTSPSIFQAFSAWLISLLRRRPFLLEVRDLWPEFAIDMGVLTNPILIFAARRLESFLYARATRIVVNSPAYREYLVERGIQADRIAFIPNGIDPEMFLCGSEEGCLRAELDLQGKYLVVYTGALGMANDIDTILDAAKILSDENRIHFLLVGDGKERRRLEDVQHQLGLKNVTFTGIRPKEEIPRILAEADVCVATLQNIPMFRTTYPNKVFDYMAAARPVILGIDGVIRDVVERAHGGICVPPGNAEALAAAIRTLSKDAESSVRMGNSNRQYVCTHFDRNTHGEMLNRLLCDVAERRAA